MKEKEQEKLMRLFVAIDLPSKTQNQLESIGCGLPGARWVPAELMHLTLRFVGEVQGAEFLDIQDALAEVHADKFTIQIKGVGCFPTRGQPKVVWAGMAPNPELLHFQKKIESVLVREADLEPERRKYSPHITLARLKDTPEQRVGNFLEEYGLLETSEFTAERFTLFSSILTQKGARHTVESEYLLGE